MRRTIVLATLLLSMPSASAQIEGNVVDTAGKAIPGAVIIAVDSINKRSDTAMSDKRGFFTFRKLKRGDYKVVITAAGFQNSVNEKIVVENESPADNPGGDDISNATWLEIVMRRPKPLK